MESFFDLLAAKDVRIVYTKDYKGLQSEERHFKPFFILFLSTDLFL